jgi:hypothetical protein
MFVIFANPLFKFQIMFLRKSKAVIVTKKAM